MKKFLIWFALIFVAVFPLGIIFSWLGLDVVEILIVWLAIGWWAIWSDIAHDAAERV